MTNLSFTACSFYITRFGKSNSIIPLNHEIDIEVEDGNKYLLANSEELLGKVIKSLSGKMNHYRDEKIFRFDDSSLKKLVYDDFVSLCVAIKSGSYGDVSDIVNIDTGENQYKKKRKDAEEKTFYLYIVIPKDSEQVCVNKGLFFFQNIGAYGVKTITTDLMNSVLRDVFDLRINCRTVAPELFIKKLVKEDNLFKVELCKNHKSSDDSDNIGNLGYGEETRILSNLVLKDNSAKEWIDRLKHCMKGKSTMFEFEGKSYDNIKLVVKIGDKPRTVNAHNIENVSIVEYLPEDIVNSEGHPDETKFINHMKDVADEYLSEMVLEIK